MDSPYARYTSEPARMVSSGCTLDSCNSIEAAFGRPPEERWARRIRGTVSAPMAAFGRPPEHYQSLTAKRLMHFYMVRSKSRIYGKSNSLPLAARRCSKSVWGWHWEPKYTTTLGNYMNLNIIWRTISSTNRQNVNPGDMSVRGRHWEPKCSNTYWKCHDFGSHFNPNVAHISSKSHSKRY
jgi:hypothetical protein